jgi:hypothetical protein
MSDIVTDDAQLRRCLLPMEVTNEVCRNQSSDAEPSQVYAAMMQ